MTGKVIVITGANGGLGRALAKRFAADGESVVLLGRSLAKVQEVAQKIGGNSLAVACDVASPDSVRAAFAEIAKTHPKIDALINSAAIYWPFPLDQGSDEQIIGTILTNLAGPILCSRAAIPMINRNGHIINLSSESIDVPFPFLTIYQATKGGVERFSQHLGPELEDRGIRVTTVRAGQMYDPESPPLITPEVAAEFFAAAMKRGLNLEGRGMSDYNATTDVFRSLLDLPPDVHVELVTFKARHAG